MFGIATIDLSRIFDLILSAGLLGFILGVIVCFFVISAIRKNKVKKKMR